MWRSNICIVAIVTGGVLLLDLAPRAAAQCSMGSNYNGIALCAGVHFKPKK